MTLLGMAGLVSAEGMKNMRKYAVVGILTLAAIITPPDVITQVILFTVVYMLYEISIQLVAAVERKREKRLREEGFYDDEDDAGHPEDTA
jgi:sec-independent protein translocase protein TatC